MGAANPLAAGEAVLEVARELGLARLRVAVVTGDDVLPWMLAHDVPLMDSDQSDRAKPGRPADLGQRLPRRGCLLPALQAGADVVITGRVADPALFLAPLMSHFGWALQTTGSAGAGHRRRSSARMCGPGQWRLHCRPGVCGHVPRLDEVGFPLAEVQADGTCVITKLAGTGGRVDRLTCTAQLLYELEDPGRYLQPDVTAEFSGVHLTEVGPDRVQVEGASGHTRPDQLKVTLGYREGFIGEGQISYAGPGARARGELALSVLERRLQSLGLAALEHRAELIGVNAMHGPALGADREPYEVRVRLAARTPPARWPNRSGQEVEALYLNGPAGGGGVTMSVREVVAVASALIPRDAVRTRMPDPGAVT
jgi:hypothetical protein